MNYTYRCVHLVVYERADVPGINCGVWTAEAGRNGKTLPLKEALSAGLILHRGNPPATCRLLPTGGCPGGTGREGRAAGSGPAAQPRRGPCEWGARWAAPPPPPSPFPSPTKNNPPKNPAWQSCRRCSSRGSPSRGTGLILPFASGLYSGGGRPQPGRGGVWRAGDGVSRSPGCCAARGNREQNGNVPCPRATGDRGQRLSHSFIF